MTNYIQIAFEEIQPEQQEVLIAILSESGYEGFEQGDFELKAYIPENKMERTLLREICLKYQVSFTETALASRNWNDVWESNFQPVIVDDFVAIRAHFHQPIKNVIHEVVITPKMSFGTGHHATTAMMIKVMKEIGFSGKSVFDFGTGTGVLSILAEKLGAKKILAIDIDEWSMANAAENIQQNACNNIELLQKSDAELAAHFDIILANINKNVILENLSSLVSQLNQNGVLLLSGLLVEDEVDVQLHIRKYPLVFKGKTTDRGWITLRFER